MLPLRWLLDRFLIQLSLLVIERGNTSLECRSQIDVSRYDTPVHKTEHTITNIVLSDWWWLSERIISEILG